MYANYMVKSPLLTYLRIMPGQKSRFTGENFPKITRCVIGLIQSQAPFAAHTSSEFLTLRYKIDPLNLARQRIITTYPLDNSTSNQWSSKG